LADVAGNGAMLRVKAGVVEAEIDNGARNNGGYFLVFVHGAQVSFLQLRASRFAYVNFGKSLPLQ
jgi:hypothetical protein